MTDWEYSDSSCPKCGAQLATRSCNGCGGEGYVEDDDGVNGLSYDPCDTCDARGHQTWCRGCGWDVNYNRFLSPQYEAEWKAKRGTT